MRSAPSSFVDPVHKIAALPVPESVRIAVDRVVGKALTSSEARVLRLRFGLGVHPCRVSEIARRLGVRVTTVIRLQSRALRKLRATALDDNAVHALWPAGDVFTGLEDVNLAPDEQCFARSWGLIR